MKDWKRHADYLLRPRMNIENAIDRIAQKYSLSREVVENYLNPPKQFEKIQTAQGESSKMPVPRIATKSFDALKKAHGYDDTWEIVKSTTKEWNAYSKRDGIVDLVSSAIEVKPIKGLSPTQIIDTYTQLKPANLKEYTYNRIEGKRYLLELPMADLHFGKLAWDKETIMDYDLNIAMDLFQKMLKQVLEIQQPIEEIIYIVGNDFFNMDNNKQETDKGTFQDCDGRWPKIYMKGCEAIIWAVENLRKIAPVKVLNIRGNHDYTWSYFATMNTSAWFRNCKNVEVSISPRGRKYYQYGNNLIGWTHGEEKPDNLKTEMQAEAPELWGATKYRELHAGHKHIEEVKSFNGFIFRRIPTYIPPDSWHVDAGYVGQTLRTQAFLWEHDRGLEQIMNINLDI